MDSPRTITRSGLKRSRLKRAEAPFLFLALQCERPADSGARFSLAAVNEVTAGRGESLGTSTVAGGLRIDVRDSHMSSRHLRLTQVLGEWIAEDLGSKNGTRVDGQPLERTQLRDGALIEAGDSFFIFRAALPQASSLIASRDLGGVPHGLETLLPAVGADFERVPLVARSRLPVLLRGETGTGKEMMAKAIHRLSGRTGPFIPVNCGALPATLVESELFGYRKGAFTGAIEDRPGLIRSAEGGTLLLDELGDLPLSAQSALLRVLQEEEVTPVGTTRPIKMDLRVIAATHRDLAAMVAEGTFREDLLARISGYVVSLPPLRERREDLGLIVAALLRRIAPERKLTLAPEAGRALLAYRWPGNVRELDKCLSGAAVFATDGPIELEHLPPSISAPAESAPLSAPRISEDDRIRRDEVIAQLRAHDGNVTAAARAMGKARTQVQRWLRRFGIDPLSYRR